MAGSGLPTTLMICCPLPNASAADAEAVLQAGLRSAVPVTWVMAAERLAAAAERLARVGVPGQLAVEIPAGASRIQLRHLLAQAAADAPGIDAAWSRGPVPDDLRSVLVDAGIRVVCRDRFEASSRGSRRPAPTGWPCRSTTWGLWEVARTGTAAPGMVGRLLPWARGAMPAAGSLAVIDVGSQGTAPAAVTRIEQWRTWATRGRATGGISFATLSDLPALITGAGRAGVGGSVLRAA